MNLGQPVVPPSLNLSAIDHPKKQDKYKGKKKINIDKKDVSMLLSACHQGNYETVRDILQKDRNTPSSSSTFVKGQVLRDNEEFDSSSYDSWASSSCCSSSEDMDINGAIAEFSSPGVP